MSDSPHGDSTDVIPVPYVYSGHDGPIPLGLGRTFGKGRTATGETLRCCRLPIEKKLF